MPEGHTLHRLAARVRRELAGRAIRSSSPQGRFAAAASLDGEVVEDAQAHGKHLVVSFASRPEVVHVHLGLYGKVAWTRHEPGQAPPVRGQVRWRVSAPAAGEGGPTVTADLRGPTACELWTPEQVTALIGRLGPDPLREDADPERAWQRISGSRSSLAVLLMDQSVVAGVGNVYRAEVLFRQRLDPMLVGRDLQRAHFDALWADLVALMARGVRTGRIDTVDVEHDPVSMNRPPRRDDHGGEVYVYRRDGQPCFVCETPVATAQVAARNLFWCPACQNGAEATRPAGTVTA